ncbi:MAG: HipA domain-containing protein [Pseudomonadota bacterium]
MPTGGVTVENLSEWFGNGALAVGIGSGLTGFDGGGDYEMIARVVEQFTSPAHASDSMAELFKSIVLSVVVRNGDAHLKNFGLLYTTPHQSDVRLSPLFDVVNTTCYIPKDVLAINLAKTKSWPCRKELVEFGKRICHVDRADDVIDSIADAAETYVPLIETGEIWPMIKKEIEVDARVLLPAR